MGKMYSTFEGGYKLISKRATLEPQFRITASLGSESTDVRPVYVNTLPGMTSIGIPIAKSTPGDPDRPNTFHAHSYSLCTRHIRTIFK